MSWKEKVKEFGGGDLSFLSEDGEVICFVVCGEPILLEGKFKGKLSEKVGCPVVTEYGFSLLIVGKRLFRKIAKREDGFDKDGYMAIRHGEQGDITATYDLKVLDNSELVKRLFEVKKKQFKKEMIAEAVIAAQDVMNQ
ncbi:hypothetical protein ES703_38071 [subsurface metagenome]